MKTWDVIIIGAGLIGTSLSLALRKQGATVLLVEREAPGREASHAAAGMLAQCDPHLPQLLRPLALASAKLYPGFIHDLEDESGQQIDFRRQGTIVLLDEVSSGAPAELHSGFAGEESSCDGIRQLTREEVRELEPNLTQRSARAVYLPEAAVDPRQLTAAALAAAKHRGVDLASGSGVTEIILENQRVAGVRTPRTQFRAPVVVNCAGAWAGQIVGSRIPTRPVKGHMLAVAAPIGYGAHGEPLAPCVLRHVLRAPDVYLAPRSDGRIVIGSTLEEAGFDKRVDPAVIQRLHEAASTYLPPIRDAKILESWTGLRPGTPDNLPILDETPEEGYFVATGHYRDGILLAPITAHLMAHLIRGLEPELDLSAFTLARFT
jgi:glycine oxidase